MRQRIEKETKTIRYLIQQRLKTSLPVESETAAGAHLDEDTICAFVEGRLRAAESLPIISHLIACGSCRRTTAQLVRLESQVADEPELVIAEESPSGLRALFENLAARINLLPEEDAVFAYRSPEERPDQEKEPTEPTPGEPVQKNPAPESQGQEKDS